MRKGATSSRNTPQKKTSATKLSKHPNVQEPESDRWVHGHVTYVPSLGVSLALKTFVKHKFLIAHLAAVQVIHEGASGEDRCAGSGEHVYQDLFEVVAVLHVFSVFVSEEARLLVQPGIDDLRKMPRFGVGAEDVL